jgi:3-hydroxyisobutyrate dehydrogenase-like beta-hydroxyacid dehydrogenase
MTTPANVQSIAFLGLGAMGSRMARRLLAAGHRVAVYNRSPDRARALAAEGARQASTARAAATGADLVIAMVSDDAASRALWLDEREGAAAGLRPGAIAVESSTLTPGWVRELGARLAARGAAFLDAPVVGSRPQAEGGALIYLVGGEAETLTSVRPVLSALGSAVHHVGPLGAGATFKLAANALFGAQVAVLGELCGVLRHAGIDSSTAIALLSSLPMWSPAMQGAGAQIAARAFAPLFPINLVEKDLRYLVETARAVHALTPTCAAVHDVYTTARRKGHGDDNIAGVAQLFE